MQALRKARRAAVALLCALAASALIAAPALADTVINRTGTAEAPASDIILDNGGKLPMSEAKITTEGPYELKDMKVWANNQKVERKDNIAYTGPIEQGTNPLPEFTLTWTDTATDGAGDRCDVILRVHNIYYMKEKPQSEVPVDTIGLLFGVEWLGAGSNFNYQGEPTENEAGDGWAELCAARYDIEFRAVKTGTETPAEGNYVFSVKDIDAAPTMPDEFKEHILFKDGQIAAVYLPKDSPLDVREEGPGFYSTEGDDTGERTAMVADITSGSRFVFETANYRGAALTLFANNGNSTIKATANEGGSISDAGDTLVPWKHDKGYTITPDPGYRIARVLVDGIDVGPVEGYQFPTVTANHTIEAFFEPAPTASYTVRYVDAEGTQLADPKTVDGQTVGATVTERAIDIEGYEVAGEAEQSVEVAESGTEIVFVYQPATEPGPGPEPEPGTADYTVRYVDEQGTALAEAKTVTGAEVGTTVTESAIEIEGYTLIGEAEQSVEVAESGTEIVFVYAKGEATASYTVRYVDAEGNALAEPKTVDGQPVGATVTERAIDIEGYEVAGEAEQSVEVAESGTEIVFVYQPATEPAPGKHTVIFVDGMTGDELGRAEYAPGEMPEAPQAPEHDGFAFKGWSPEISPVTGDAVYTAVYEPDEGNPLKVEKSQSAGGSVAVGETIAYTLTATNTGSEPISGVAIYDAVPEGTRLAAMPEGAKGDGTYVSWLIGELAPGESRQVVFKVEVIERKYGHIEGPVTEGTAEDGSPTAASAAALGWFDQASIDELVAAGATWHEEAPGLPAVIDNAATYGMGEPDAPTEPLGLTTNEVSARVAEPVGPEPKPDPAPEPEPSSSSSATPAPVKPEDPASPDTRSTTSSSYSTTSSNPLASRSTSSATTAAQRGAASVFDKAGNVLGDIAPLGATLLVVGASVGAWGAYLRRRAQDDQN